MGLIAKSPGHGIREVEVAVAFNYFDRPVAVVVEIQGPTQEVGGGGSSCSWDGTKGWSVAPGSSKIWLYSNPDVELAGRTGLFLDDKQIATGGELVVIYMSENMAPTTLTFSPRESADFLRDADALVNDWDIFTKNIDAFMAKWIWPRVGIAEGKAHSFRR